MDFGDVFLVSQALVLSLAIGTLMGLIGGGGGFVYVLLLIITFKRPAHEAIGTALLLATLGSATAVFSHWQQHNLAWRQSLVLGTVGAVAAMLGSVATQFVPEGLLKWLIVVLFALLGVQPFVRLRRPKPDNLPVEQSSWTRHVRRLTVGGLIGVGVGSFGISGGTPLSTYLNSYESLTIPQSIGTALVIVTAMSLMGSVTHLSFGNLHAPLFGILGVGSMAGAYLGARLTARVDQRALMIVLGGLTLLTTLGLVIQL